MQIIDRPTDRKILDTMMPNYFDKFYTDKEK